VTGAISASLQIKVKNKKERVVLIEKKVLSTPFPHSCSIRKAFFK